MPTDFENYAAVSSIYDYSRPAVGLAHVLRGFEQCTSRGRLLLDVGCGTANYLNALGETFNSAIGVDRCPEMLCLARRKMLNNVALVRGDMLSIPFEPDSFDFLLSTFVIHHLPVERQRDSCFAFLLEAYRVLRPGGVFVLGTTAADQYDDGFWWSPLLPEAVKDVKSRLPIKTLDDGWFHDAADEIGFETIGRHVNYTDTLQRKDQYLNIEKYFDPSFRNGISTWALASPTERDSAIAQIRKINTDETYVTFLNSREQARNQVGQSVFITYRKPGV